MEGFSFKEDYQGFLTLKSYKNTAPLPSHYKTQKPSENPYA